MVGAGRLAMLALALTMQAALAEAPATSPRPVPRGAAEAAVETGAVETGAVETGAVETGAVETRPRARPAEPEGATEGVPQATVAVAERVSGAMRPRPRPLAAAAAATDLPAPLPPAAGLARSLRPVARPQNFAALLAVPRQEVAPAPITAPAPVAAPAPQAERPRRGLLGGLFGRPRDRPERSPDAPRGTYVCGDRAIIGRELDPIGNPTRGCGVAEPVQVTMVDGVALSQAATMDCQTALALHRWIDEGLRPAFRGREPVQLTVAAHYICRTRNNRPGARMSEHGRGRAIDIAGITFADGRTVSVAGDYGRALRQAHWAACGIFGTTLGPGSDGYHEDHLHFDTASHSNGPYCR